MTHHPSVPCSSDLSSGQDYATCHPFRHDHSAISWWKKRALEIGGSWGWPFWWEMTTEGLSCHQIFDSLLFWLLFASPVSTEEETALYGSKGKVWFDGEDFCTIVLIKFWSWGSGETVDSPLIRKKTDNICLLGLKVGWTETAAELMAPWLREKLEFSVVSNLGISCIQKLASLTAVLPSEMIFLFFLLKNQQEQRYPERFTNRASLQGAFLYSPRFQVKSVPYLH